MQTIHPLAKIRALIPVPADKSISHRALLAASLSGGSTFIDNFLWAEDTQATLRVLKSAGVSITAAGAAVKVIGQGKYYSRGNTTLSAGESGTTLRLLAGILAAQRFRYTLTGEASLRKRPMARVTMPLRMMGADIQGIHKGEQEFAPLLIRPVRSLRGIKYSLPVKSAQVKSALLFAGLYAQSETMISEPVLSRDHTERMLELFGVDLKRSGRRLAIKKSSLKNVPYVYIPGDISSAAFFIALGALSANSELLIEKVGINPTRMGLLSVLKRMGANIRLLNPHYDYFEPYADILVTSGPLRACRVKGNEIPCLIDELPVLFLCAARARGTSFIEGVEELRVKETDRIQSMLYNLRQLGVRCEVLKKKSGECLTIEGIGKFGREPRFKSFGDHRTAMACVVAGLLSARRTFIDEVQCINKSFPAFMGIVRALYKL